jgi:hypothetical protein
MPDHVCKVVVTLDYWISNDKGMHSQTVTYETPAQSPELLKQFADGISSVMELAKLTQRD